MDVLFLFALYSSKKLVYVLTETTWWVGVQIGGVFHVGFHCNVGMLSTDLVGVSWCGRSHCFKEVGSDKCLDILQLSVRHFMEFSLVRFPSYRLLVFINTLNFPMDFFTVSSVTCSSCERN